MLKHSCSALCHAEPPRQALISALQKATSKPGVRRGPLKGGKVYKVNIDRLMNCDFNGKCPECLKVHGAICIKHHVLSIFEIFCVNMVKHVLTMVI